MRVFAYYAILISLLSGVALGVLSSGDRATLPPHPFQDIVGATVELTGVIVSAPDDRETGTRITVRIERDNQRTNVLAVVPRHLSLKVGDVVQVTGKVERPKPFDGDGGRVFAYDRFLAKDGITLIMLRASVAVVGTDTSPWLRFLRVLGDLRGWFVRSLELALPDPESALATGIIVGGKQGLGAELLDAFTVAGMLQLVVLSGYNVAIVADGVVRVLSWLPKRIATTTAIAVIGCFVLAAGAGSSALRAGLMSAIALLAHATDRPYIAVRVLVLTLAILAITNPLLVVYDPGLHFSFLATLGLLVGTPIVEQWFTGIKHRTIRQLLASSIAAQLGVLPMLLWQTGNLSIVSLPANIFASLVIPAAMATSAIAAVVAIPLSFVSPVLPLVVGIPAYVLLTYVIHIATVSASLPYASVVIPSFSVWVMIGAYAALGLVVWRYHKPSQSDPGLRGFGALGY